MRGENPFTIHEIFAALAPLVTPEVPGLPSLLPLNRYRIITLKAKMRVPVHPISVF